MGLDSPPPSAEKLSRENFKKDLERRVKAAKPVNDNTPVLRYLDENVRNGCLDKKVILEQLSTGSIRTGYQYRLNGELVATVYHHEGAPFWVPIVAEERDYQYLAYRADVIDLKQRNDLFALLTRLQLQLDQLALTENRINDKIPFHGLKDIDGTINDDGCVYNLDREVPAWGGLSTDTRKGAVEFITYRETTRHPTSINFKNSGERPIYFIENGDKIIAVYLKSGPDGLPDLSGENIRVIRDPKLVDRPLNKEELEKYSELFSKYLLDLKYEQARKEIDEKYRKEYEKLLEDIRAENTKKAK